ncbi:unnamed protein product [Paramecium sonneborni]|uniref:Uncharacterized protein n=1 Tax=Paramecium sonneborni TaxID=65129 RepID=A0A8S1QRF2_9CILI|nr:unnamed protein product [Paramecium sonneborni]
MLYQTNKIKVLVIGDKPQEKTRLLYSYVNGRPPQEYCHIVFDNHIIKFQINGEEYMVHLWDSAGQERYERLRELSYKDKDIFLICFSMACKFSFQNAILKWQNEVSQYENKNGVTMMLGLKSEERDLFYQSLENDHVNETIRSMGLQYREVNLNTLEGLTEAFNECIKIVIDKRQEHVQLQLQKQNLIQVRQQKKQSSECQLQ